MAVTKGDAQASLLDIGQTFLLNDPKIKLINISNICLLLNFLYNKILMKWFVFRTINYCSYIIIYQK